jgi:hypothetical protein
MVTTMPALCTIWCFRNHNLLTAIPDVSACVHLAELRVGFNAITRVPDTLAINGNGISEHVCMYRNQCPVSTL